jgi:hypothetical protein
MNTVKKMQTAPLAAGDGPPPMFVDDFSVLSINDGSDGVVRLCLFGVIDSGGPGTPQPGALALARPVLTIEKARQLAQALLQHVGTAGEVVLAATNENLPH